MADRGTDRAPPVGAAGPAGVPHGGGAAAPAASGARKRSRRDAEGEGGTTPAKKGLTVADFDRAPHHIKEEDLAFIDRHGEGTTLVDSLLGRQEELKEELSACGGNAKKMKKEDAYERRTTHWDFLLKEMLWMSEDFKSEKKRHQARAKKISKAIETYHRQAEARALKKEKDEALRIRRVAAKVARSVKSFWGKINKVVAYKQKLEMDSIRKASMDKQLTHIVEQTERYTKQLLIDFQNPGETSGSERPRDEAQYMTLSASERSATEADSDDGEFEGEDEEDDETTIAEAERSEKFGDGRRELAALQKDSEIPIEELIETYKAVQDMEVESPVGQAMDDDDSGAEASDEYEASDEEGDDETTIAQAEAEDSDDAEEEIAKLKAETEQPIEDLLALYQRMQEAEAAEGEGARGDGNALAALMDEEGSSGRRGDEAGGDSDGAMDEEGTDVDEAREEAPAAGASDSEYSDAAEMDDETTIAMAEQEDGGDAEEEISALQKGAEVPIEQLLELYAQMQEEQEDGDGGGDGDGDGDGDGGEGKASPDEERSAAAVGGKHEDVEVDADEDADENEDSDENEDEDEDEDEDDFVGTEEADDETTIQHEEASKDDAEAEIEALKKDTEQPIEELLAMYAQMQDELSDGTTAATSKDGGEGGEEDEDEEEEEMEDGGDSGEGSARATDEGRATAASEVSQSDGQSDHLLKRMVKIDEQLRSRRVERPYLLTPTLKLRKYQEIGVSWLVSLHERRLNGILADEMGLGKTIQTIALLAYLACFRGVWGPHLIVVPTSCIVNWESEIKKFCPAFKVLTYYGSAQQRKALRVGWSKLNSFHICITSYQLVVKDASSFRRKKWYYLILDEAHNIKNFESQRWQTMVSFNTQRRLLLTGTPLQNSLMELWALMHFLMPHIFRSRTEFSYWFSNPLNSMVEGNSSVSGGFIRRLHGIMRPFILRRLKKDVAKQLPGKFEHIVPCPLSRRQQHLYEEFMSRSSTRAALSGGAFMGMMNVLMQLRKVCNHPDLFEPRPIKAPFKAPTLAVMTSRLVTSALAPRPFEAFSAPGLGDRRLAVNHLRLPLDIVPQSAHGAAENGAGGPRAAFVQLQDLHLSTEDRAALSSDGSVRLRFEGLSQRRRAEAMRRRRVLALLNAERRRDKPLDKIRRLDRRFSGLTMLLALAARRAEDDSAFGKWFPKSLCEMVRRPADRYEGALDLIKAFVFVTPGVVAATPVLFPADRNVARAPTARHLAALKAQGRGLCRPFYAAHVRQRISFPDRKLVQYDSGKLQTLAVLLRRLKRGGHRCLIFTQMSKMLNTLEEFLNLHGHTYLRLDGSTGVDRRQKLMDRFNTDEKMFCFILSTRSGGLGINLTGADTVIFYDSDWNPAMDAQAQDRAHRIGQTRDVHIYRLVCKGTVEENILTKARQKRRLDMLVMTEGNFSASFFTQDSLRSMLLNKDESAAAPKRAPDAPPEEVSEAQVTAAMASLEDEEDAKAMAQAAAEAKAELNEPEDAKGEASEAEASDATSAAAPAATKDDEHKQFMDWQAKVGADTAALEASLRPTERYAVRFKTTIDPFYSQYFLSDEQRRAAAAAESAAWDTALWEEERAAEEARCLKSGELIATGASLSSAPVHERSYRVERKRRASARKLRRLKGDNWVVKTDGRTGLPFYYNVDSGEATWFVPREVAERDALSEAAQMRYNAVPRGVLRRVLSFLSPLERAAAAGVCRRFREEASAEVFHRRIASAERMSQAKGAASGGSLEDAVRAALPGETLVLEPGHHWVESVVVDKPLRIVGHGQAPQRCVIELGGSFTWKAKAGTMADLSLRRPRRSDAESHLLQVRGRVSLHQLHLDADGNSGAALYAAPGARLDMHKVLVANSAASGVYVAGGAVACLSRCRVAKSKAAGVHVGPGGALAAHDCFLNGNGAGAVSVDAGGAADVRYCDVSGNSSIDAGRRKRKLRVKGVAEAEAAPEQGAAAAAAAAVVEPGGAQAAGAGRERQATRRRRAKAAFDAEGQLREAYNLFA